MRLKFLRLIWFILDTKERKRLGTILVLIIFNSLLDFLGLASILPAVIALKDPTIVKTNRFLSSIYTAIPFDSVNVFILFLLLSVLFIYIIKSVVSVLIVNYNTLRIFEISTRLSKKILGVIFNKSLLYIRDNSSSNLYRQINSYPTLFGSAILFNLLVLLSESFIVILILFSILLYNYKVFLIVIGLNGPIIYLFNVKYRNRIKVLGRSVNTESINLVKVFYNVVQGFVDIKMRNKESDYANLLMGHTQKVNRLTASSMVLGLLPSRILELNAIFVLVIIYSTSFLMPISNEVVFTIIGFFVIASYRIMPSASKIMQATLAIKNNIYVLPFLYKLLKSDQQNEPSQKEVLVFKDKILFNQVSLSYSKNGRDVLNNFNLEIRKNEMLGIVGESGAGKSSLVNLLLGFVRPTSGGIFVDGVGIDSIHINSWRSHIGYVKQDTFIFDGSIAENISLGENSSEAREKIIDCLSRAHLSEFLMEQKYGIDTQVGEMGGKISGGQKQRMGIARAIYHNPDVLIFDEATSALDRDTEREIVNEIRELKDQNKSIIIIAHRYSNLKYCDRILKMEEGQIKHIFSSFDEFSKYYSYEGVS